MENRNVDRRAALPAVRPLIVILSGLFWSLACTEDVACTPTTTRVCHSTVNGNGAEHGALAVFAAPRTQAIFHGARRLLATGSAMRPWAPRRDPHNGPWADSWQNTIAICAAARNENATDVNEWLAYYKWLGVDHVFFTENESEWSVKDAIRQHIDAGFVTFDTLAGAHAQMTIYHRCIQQHGNYFDWMAFFDLDEYLLVREKGQTLKQVLNDYRFFPGLAVHWIMVGSSHRRTRPPQGGVLQHYTQCAPGGNVQVKTIANMFFVDHAGIHPHNVVYRAHTVPVNEQFLPLPYRFGISDSSCPDAHATPMCPLFPGHTFPKTSRSPSVARVALYHYVTRSEEDFMKKMMRAGGTTSSAKTMGFFHAVQRLAIDHPICQEPAKLYDLCCKVPGTGR